MCRELVVTLADVLGSPSEAVQEHALRALGSLANNAEVAKSIGGVPGALATVAKLLQSRNDAVRASATWALAWLAMDADNETSIATMQGTLSALANLLDSADTQLQEAAAAALQNLAQIDGEVYEVPRALTSLAQLLESPSKAVRKQAAKALSDLAADHKKVTRIAAMGPRVFAALVKLLGSPTEGGEEEATQALATLAADAKNMKSIASEPGALAKLLRSPSEDLQKQAAEALVRLAKYFRNLRGIAIVPGVLAGLVVQLGSLNRGMQQRSAEIFKLLAWDVEHQRSIGMEPGALAALGKLLRSPSEAVQEEAVRALARLAGTADNRKSIAALPGVLVDLRQLLGSHRHLQEHAAKTLEHLAGDPDNQRSIATFPGVLAGLVELLGHPYGIVKRNAAGALANLAVNAENKRSIVAVPGALAALRNLLRSVQQRVPEQGARALENVAADDDNKKSIAATPGLLAALVESLQYHWLNGSNGGEHAATALASLAARADIRRTLLAEPRILSRLGHLLVSPSPELLQKRAAFALRNLAGVDDNRTVATVPGAMAALGKLLGSPSEAVQSRAAGTLANLASKESSSVAAVPGVLGSLMELLGSRSEAVQSQAARALGSLGKDAGIRARILAEAGTLAALTRLLASPSEEVQKQAGRARDTIERADPEWNRHFRYFDSEGYQLDFKPTPDETSESSQQSPSGESAVAILEPGVPLPDTRVEAGTGEGSTEQGIEVEIEGPTEVTEGEADRAPDNMSDSQTPFIKNFEPASLAPPSDSAGSAFEPSDAPGPPQSRAETELQQGTTEVLGGNHAVDLEMPIENIAARIHQLEAGLGRGGALELTPIQSEYLGRLLDREGDVKGLEEEMATIAKDPGALRYYGSLRRALSWAFLGAQASCSNLVVRQRDKVNRALVLTASAVAGLVPGYGHVASKVAGAAAGFVADFFEGRRAERIARAGGTDGEAIADGVARSLVFLRKGELSQTREDGVREVASRDFGRMTKWMKDQDDLQTIRDENDLTGEGVIRKLVAAAEPTWPVPLGRLRKAPQTHPPPPPTVSVQAAIPTPLAVATSTVTSISVKMVTTEELLRRHEELEGRLRTRDEELESERRRHKEEIESVKEQMTILKARHAAFASTVDAGDGLAFMQARAQQRAVVCSWDDLRDGECYDIDQQVHRLSGKLDDVEGRLNRIEKDYNRETPARARRKGV